KYGAASARRIAVPTKFSSYAGNNNQHNDENQEGQKLESATAAMLLGNGLSRPFVFAADRLKDQIDPGCQASLIISGPEKLLDVTLSDVECCRVRQRAFQAVADLDKHFAVMDKHKKNHAVAPLFLAHAPRLCHALRVIGDIRVALHFGKNCDHHLVGGVSLELRELLVKPINSFL